MNKIDRMTNDGYDEIEFFISTNVGQDLKPLNKNSIWWRSQSCDVST